LNLKICFILQFGAAASVVSRAAVSAATGATSQLSLASLLQLLSTFSVEPLFFSCISFFVEVLSESPSTIAAVIKIKFYRLI
jgi:hypothetical protein